MWTASCPCGDTAFYTPKYDNIHDLSSGNFWEGISVYARLNLKSKVKVKVWIWGSQMTLNNEPKNDKWDSLLQELKLFPQPKIWRHFHIRHQKFWEGLKELAWLLKCNKLQWRKSSFREFYLSQCLPSHSGRGKVNTEQEYLCRCFAPQTNMSLTFTWLTCDI